MTYYTIYIIKEGGRKVNRLYCHHIDNINAAYQCAARWNEEDKDINNEFEVREQNGSI